MHMHYINLMLLLHKLQLLQTIDKKVNGIAKDVYEVQNELIAIIRQMVMKKNYV